MGWGREQQAKDHQGNVGPNQPPISAKHTSAPVRSPGVGHWAEGVQGGGRLLPRPGVGRLPASRLALLRAAGPLPRLWWGLPSHIPSRGSRRHGDGSRVLGAAVLLRPVPGVSEQGACRN